MVLKKKCKKYFPNSKLFYKEGEVFQFFVSPVWWLVWRFSVAVLTIRSSGSESGILLLIVMRKHLYNSFFPIFITEIIRLNIYIWKVKWKGPFWLLSNFLKTTETCFHPMPVNLLYNHFCYYLLFLGQFSTIFL